MNHIKLFEQFIADIEEALTPGQSRAQKGGKDLLNPGQAAAAYILALHQIVEYSRDTPLGKELFKKYGNTRNIMSEVFGVGWKEKDYATWYNNDLTDMLNIKASSLGYAIKKMDKMLRGDFSKDGTQVLYDVIIGYFEMIQAMSKDQLVDFVNDYRKNPTDARFVVQ